jgi:glutamate synthase domain-containing protein 3
MNINAENMHYKDLNQMIKDTASDVVIDNCMGQRYIGNGQSDKLITINGTPGNALGAYLNGAKIIVNGNVQDAVGDTMNDGKIFVNGNAGDALGYAMRGGQIYVRGNAGYRTGIHMKEYKEKKPVLVIGGSVGSFLGEYLAGGIIIVLGNTSCNPVVGNFTGTGLHGGKIFIKCECPPSDLPKQVVVAPATSDDLKEITPYLEEYSNYFSVDMAEITKGTFYVLKPNTQNPYKQLYTTN